MQTHHHDHKSLEPHPHIHNQRNHEQRPHRRSNLLDPHQLRNRNIAKNQRPIRHPVRPRHAIHKREPLISVPAVKCRKRLHHVAVSHDQSRSQHHLGHILQMPHGDEIFQSIEFANGNRKRHYHRKARINRAGHKVRRKNRSVPAGNHRRGKVEAHHRVHGNHQRRSQPREQQRCHLIPMPVHRRPSPTHRQNSVQNLLDPAASPVAQCRQVRNQAHKPEQQRHSRVSRYREHIPNQWAAKLRPRPHRVGIRKHPVSKPRTPHMQQRKHPRASHRKQRHGLGKSIDRGAPFLTQQKKNRGNQRPGVPDSNPPDEIDDRKAPADGNIDAPYPHADRQQPSHRVQKHHQQRERDGEAEEPAAPPPLPQHDRADFVGDGAGRVPRP